MLPEEHFFQASRAFEGSQPRVALRREKVQQTGPGFQPISFYPFQITLDVLVAVAQANYPLTGSIFLRERKVCNLWSKSMALNWGSLYFLVILAPRYVMSSHLSTNCSNFFLYFLLEYSELCGLKAFRWNAIYSSADLFTLKKGNLGFKHPAAFIALISEVAIPCRRHNVDHRHMWVWLLLLVAKR